MGNSLHKTQNGGRGKNGGTLVFFTTSYTLHHLAHLESGCRRKRSPTRFPWLIRAPYKTDRQPHSQTCTQPKHGLLELSVVLVFQQLQELHAESGPPLISGALPPSMTQLFSSVPPFALPVPNFLSTVTHSEAWKICVWLVSLL